MHELKKVELEKQVSTLMERLDMAENYNRLGRRHGDWATGGVFRVMVTPRLKDDHKGRLHKVGKSPLHPCTKIGPDRSPR